MKLPSYDAKGCINMGDVMMADPKDFKALGVDVGERLTTVKIVLGKMNPENYEKDKSDYIHELVDEHCTGNGRMRKPFYQHSAVYCFYYNLYCLIINNCRYYHMSDAEEQALDQKILDDAINKSL